MKLIGKQQLITLRDDNPKVVIWIKSWVAEVSSNHCHWGDESSIYQQFPNAKKVANGVFLFAISNSKYILETKILFPQKIVLIEGVRIR